MKKNIVTRWICLAVALIMTISFAACGTTPSEETKSSVSTIVEKATTSGTEAKPLSIKWINNATKVEKSTDTVVGKVLKDKFNVDIEFIPYSGDYRAKLNLMLASGDYPEIIRLEGNDMVEKYAKAGALIDLEPYIKDAKFFKERYKDQLPYMRLASGLDKAYAWQYGIPAQLEIVAEFNDVLVRTDALEKQGWPKLVTEEDYQKFLQQALKDFPETDGQKTLGMVWPAAEPWGMKGIASNFYEKAGSCVSTTNGMRSVIVNVDEDKIEDKWKNEYTLDNWKWWNQLYRTGLLDKECFTDFLPKVQEKVDSGRAIAVWYTVWLKDGANQKLVAAGHPERQYIKLPIRLKKQIDRNEKQWARVEVSRPFDSVGITKNCSDSKRLFDIIDWCSSDEGLMLLQSGVEGTHYNMENGKRVPTADYLKNAMDKDWANQQGIQLFNYFGNTMQLALDGQAYNLIMDPVLKDKYFLTDREKEAFQKLGWKSSTEFFFNNSKESKQGIGPSVTIDTTSELGNLQVKMVEHWVEYGAKLMIAKDDAEYEKTLKQAQSEYEKMKPERVIDEANRIYNEMKSKLDKLNY